MIPNWRDLIWLPDDELAKFDIAEVNLACAMGLPGSEKIDVHYCLDTLKKWAEHIRANTDDRNFLRLRKRYKYCWPIFRVHAMICFLQRTFGVRYDPAKMPLNSTPDFDGRFIHGPIQGNGGTCGSLPVLYVSVGRKLGYPLRLVTATGSGKVNYMGHAFFRWDDPHGDRINFDVNNTEMDCLPDHYYRTGDFTTDIELEQTGGVLKSKTPREELGFFMRQRNSCFRDTGNRRKQVESLLWAVALDPNALIKGQLESVLLTWSRELDEKKPPGFPKLELGLTARRFPATVPAEYELHYYGLSATQFLLNDPANEARWWQPMRQQAKLPRRLIRIQVTCAGDRYDVKEECQVDATCNLQS